MNDMIDSSVTIRAATSDDLPAINRIIEAAVMTWDLPERVKRLSLPGYRYDALDFDHLQFSVALDAEDRIVGVASWEQAGYRDCPAGKTALLLHGLYIDPAAQRAGNGSALLSAALAAARDAGVDGLLVKAQADAVSFFTSRGMQALPVEDQARHYANRLWKAVRPALPAKG